MGTVLKSATFLATESVNSAPSKKGERGANFWQGKVQNYSPILRCTFLAGKSAKLIANFSATKVTSLPSVSLCISLSLSLSLSPSVHHAQYRQRFRASYNEKALAVLARRCSGTGTLHQAVFVSLALLKTPLLLWSRYFSTDFLNLFLFSCS